MFKVTPNPPVTPNSETIDPRIADRALSHYNIGPDAGSKPAPIAMLHDHRHDPGSQEDALANVYPLYLSRCRTAPKHPGYPK